MLITLTFLNNQINSQQNKIRFDHLTVKDGLSQTTANAIIQDKHGFMWIGTQDGLNRYDGYNFKIFSQESGNTNSLSNNYIWSIYEDNDGILWIGTFGGGLTRFDPSTETFTHFKNDFKNQNSISSDDIFEILEYPEGTLWIRSGIGINKFDKKTKKFKHYFSKSSSIISNKNLYISAIAIQPPNFIWAAIDSFLIKLNIITNELKYFSAYPDSKGIKFGNILNIKNFGNELFICCSAGLVKIDNANNASLLIKSPTFINEKKTIFNNILIAGEFYWIGSNNGLFQYSKDGRLINHFTNNPNDPYSLAHNNVVSLYESQEGIIWVGTYGGINKIDRLVENFTLVQFKHANKNTLSHKSIGPILEDRNKILWLGTPDGLNAYNRKTNKNIIFKNIANKINSINSNYILSLYEDKSGNIWVGTRNGGLNMFNYSETNKIKDISFKEIKLSKIPLRIQSILEDKTGLFWIGTGGDGLIAFNPNTKITKQYSFSIDGNGPSHSFVYCMYIDSKNNFWLGTPTGGLNLFNRKSEKFIYIKNEINDPNSLSNNIVLSIFEDSSHQLWIGTSGGLNKLTTPLEEKMFEKAENVSIKFNFKQFGKADNFPNEVIYGLLEDDDQKFWLSTNKGLIRFDPKKEIVTKIFNEKDGLQSNEFNQNSYFKNKQGIMFFGGINGFNYFQPDSIKQNNFIPPICFTDFQLFNKTVPLKNNSKDEIFTISKPIYMTDYIELSHDKNVITFEYAALNYILPEKNQYAHMLEGFDNNWIDAGFRRSVTYTNLNPGQYILHIKGSNNDEQWNTKGMSIKLVIFPPPWLSWYAYLIYFSSFFFVVFLFIKFRINSAKKEIETHAKIEAAKLKEREEVRKQSAADFHDEAGNKLTKISLFIELAKTEVENNNLLNQYLLKIEENTKELSSGMRDFIWVIDPTKDSLFDTINRLKDFGNSIFDYTDVRFNVIGLNEPMKKINLPMEYRRAIMLIFKEAINNCIKHSSAKKVTIEVAVNDLFTIHINDDGKGFDLNMKSKGYGINNMINRAKKIGCELQITSKPTEGSSIMLIGNIPQMSN
ncbi:MAG: hypothetical protein IPH62_12040 [Ignavibacteriae bacterium]|nr:hypothetical protein [Ignavibacteriota bacterium]